MSQGQYQYQSDFAKKYVAEGEAKGEAKGKAEAILRVLAARGLSVSEAQRARVFGCTDLSRLDIWLERAVTSSSADDVFAN